MFIQAAQRDDVPALKKLLAAGVSPNALSEQLGKRRDSHDRARDALYPGREDDEVVGEPDDLLDEIKLRIRA